MTKKLLSTLLVVGALGAIAGFGTFSAFSSSTSNGSNEFEAGTVQIDDNDAGALLYDVENAKPGTTETKCIRVSFNGSLDSDVKMYASAVGTVGQYVSFTVTRGSGNVTYPSCDGATFEGSPLYSGKLKAFADAYAGWDNGLSVTPTAVATKWTGDADEAMVLKLEVAMDDDNAANGGNSRLTTGAHSFTWEARNKA